MQIIARCFKNSRLATIAFVLANIAWVFGINQLGHEIFGAMIVAPRAEEPPPLRALHKLECPFMLNSDGQGMVVATVVHPDDEIRRYTVTF